MGVALNHPFQEDFPLQSIDFGYPHWNHNSLWGAAQKVDLVDHLGVSIGSLKNEVYWCGKCPFNGSKWLITDVVNSYN